MEMCSSLLSVFSLLLSLLFTSNFNIVVPINAIFNPVTKPVISFCSGYSHTCAVFNTFQMKCWGNAASFGSSTDYGKTPSTVGDNIPFFNPGTSLGIKMVACQASSNCILLDNGDIKCAGSNDVGQAGIGSSDTIIRAPTYVGDTLPAVNLGTEVTVVSIVAGNQFTCALTIEGMVKCFGGNGLAQLGLGDRVDRGKLSSDMGENLPYVKLGTSVTVASLHTSLNSVHICAILSAPASAAQRFKCWGDSGYYQLGYGDKLYRGRYPEDMGDNLLLVDLGSESRVKYITLGWKHTCALLINDVLKCFGSGDNGQLGSGSTSTISQTGDLIPSVLIDTGISVKFVEAGEQHTCLVYDNQLTMKCFGLNNLGQLGQGNATSKGNAPTSTLPFILPIDLGTGTLKISSLHVGASYNCVVFENNSIKCFGRNDFGQLAIGSNKMIGDGPGEMGSKLEFAEIFSPTRSPTASPTVSPSRLPTNSPTLAPTPPTNAPSVTPTLTPTNAPTTNPTSSPSKSPSQTPTKKPSSNPSANPSTSPSMPPTAIPTLSPTKSPTSKPSNSPTQSCQYDKSKLCKKDPKCFWTKANGKKGCTLFNCALLDKGACRNEKKRCTFDKNTKTCITKI